MTLRSLLPIVILAFLLSGAGGASHAARLSDGFVVYVGPRSYPSAFDPYYDEPKIYRQPRYYESFSKKAKGKRVFKTTKVKDQYGRMVYKKTTSRKVKKR